MIRMYNAGILKAIEVFERLILTNSTRKLYEQHLEEVQNRNLLRK